MRQRTHPGEILGELYLNELGITQKNFAKHIGVSFRTINELVNQKRSISIEMALKLSKALNTTPHFWINLQNNYDLSRIDMSEFENIAPLAHSVEIAQA